jgi:hypothetical protein
LARGTVIFGVSLELVSGSHVAKQSGFRFLSFDRFGRSSELGCTLTRNFACPRMMRSWIWPDRSRSEPYLL